MNEASDKFDGSVVEVVVDLAKVGFTTATGPAIVVL